MKINGEQCFIITLKEYKELLTIAGDYKLLFYIIECQEKEREYLKSQKEKGKQLIKEKNKIGF